MADVEKDIFDVILDPSFPLLERFKTAAPGTYKHCLNVSELCASVADELNMDKKLMRVCGLYHDIGKIVCPKMFSENQNGDGNPHDKMNPHDSFLIITSHVSHSINILLEIDGFPIEAMKIISQHHGDMVLKSIHSKVDSEDEDNFRYYGNKPSSPEAAVLMICDEVEAASKSLFSNGDLEDIDSRKKLIDSIMNILTSDEQLDELKMKYFRLTKRILLRELDGIYHKRVVYDEEE